MTSEQIGQPSLSRILAIALPMVASQASDTVMLFVDRLMLSRVGEVYMAASMTGGLTMEMLAAFFIGTIMYVTALSAQYYGAGQYRSSGTSAYQALILGLISIPVILALSPAVRHYFQLSGQTQEQVKLGYSYFRTLAFGAGFLVLRFALTGFFTGTGRTTIVMFANLTGVLVNIPANYLLIFGKLGLPAMGLQGAALGTIIGNAAIFVILLSVFLGKRNREKFLKGARFRFDKSIFTRLLRFGLPSGLEMFLALTAFTTFVQFMHSYGPDVAAAVTITFNWDLMAFIPMLGMGHATTALVGQSIGAGSHENAKKTAYMCLKVAWVYSCAMMLLFVFGSPVLVRPFVSEQEGADTIISLATIMVRLVSLYLLIDSAHLVFAGALRGAGDTRFVMAISVGLHWIFVTVVIVMIKVVKVSPVTAWILFILFIFSLGISLFLRFRRGKWKKIEVIRQ